MSHRQGLHSDDRPYPGEELCYCDEETTPNPTPPEPSTDGGNPQDKQRDEGKTYSYDGVSRRRIWRVEFFGVVLELYGRKGSTNERQR